ncbi:MAG: sulfatase [Verrucomicrobiales bacterium]|nr:MAG: DUF4976 domain-containing protein [Verrucomicrobiaceae bacterium]
MKAHRALLAVLISVSSISLSAGKARKNVLFIAIDDLRPTLGCYGDKTAITPNIDKIAEKGTAFYRAYCQQALCSPSRLSLMTGLRPNSTKVWDLNTHFRESVPGAVTLPQHFKNQGYLTRSIGKIFHGGGKASKDPPSWSEEPVYDQVRDPKLRYALPKNLKGNGLKRDSVESVKIDDNHYVDGKVCEEAIEALKRYSKVPSPFFLAVGFRKPHLPFNAPKKYWDLYRREQIPTPESTGHPTNAPEIATRSWKELEGYTDIPSDGMIGQEKTQELRHGYYACVSYIDALVGRLIRTMSDLNLSQDTVICIWGDHGYHLGEQGLWTKANNYELSLRVPLIFSIPMQKNQGSKSHGLVELVDIYPTICEACQIEIPTGLEGESFVPLLNDPHKKWKKAAYSQFPRNRTGNRHSKHGDIMGYSVRTNTHRYTEWREWKSNRLINKELYDHRNDPREMKNIAPIKDSQGQLKALSKVLNEGWKSLQ